MADAAEALAIIKRGSDELIVLGWEVPDAFAPAELARLRDLTDALLAIDTVKDIRSLRPLLQKDADRKY